MKSNNGTKMKIYRYLFIIFSALAVVGSAYILVNGGEPNAGYALVPLVIGAIFRCLYQEEKKKDFDEDK